MIPLVGFLPASDPRVAGTVDAIQRELLVDGFVLRYHVRQTASTGSRRARACSSPARSGSPTTCGCWDGPTKRCALFERLAGLVNDVGLIAEEYDPATKRMLGNFPQAFTHVSLVNTACNLDHDTRPAIHRRRRPQEPLR